MESFGELIATRRAAQGLNQKQLAAIITKEDGNSITPQYLNDIEHGRRSPTSDHIILEFAEVLCINPDVMFAAAGIIHPDIRGMMKNMSLNDLSWAFSRFRSILSE